MGERIIVIAGIAVFFGSVPVSWFIKGGNHDLLADATLALWIGSGLAAAVLAWRRLS